MSPQLKELKKMGAGRLPLNELPETFEATLVREEIRTDRMGRDCLYWIMEIEGQGTLTQKFSPMHIDELVKALEKLGINDTKDLIGKKMLMKVQHFRIGNPRWLPAEIR